MFIFNDNKIGRVFKICVRGIERKNKINFKNFNFFIIFEREIYKILLV